MREVVVARARQRWLRFQADGPVWAAGNGCCDDVVDVNVRREEDDVVDDDCRMIIN